MTLKFVIILVLIVGFFVMIKIASFLESLEFNKGICKDCGYLFRPFDRDSQGGRGYVCDKCGKVVWVSYRTVDKDFRK